MYAAILAVACGEPSGPGTVPVAAVVVGLPSGTVYVGAPAQATLVLQDADGNTLTGRDVSWTSSDPLVATVSGTGMVTGVKPGTARITATSEGKSGFVDVSVLHGVASVVVALPQPGLSPGFTIQASDTLKDASGNILTGRNVTWSSSNTAVATVTQAGVVTAVSRGTADIIVTSEGKTGAATIGVVAVRQRSLSTGGSHTCAISISGDAYCWGANYNGQGGHHDGPNKQSPAPVRGDIKWASIMTATSVTYGLTTDGRLYCWGGVPCDPSAPRSPYDEFVGEAVLDPRRSSTTRALEVVGPSLAFRYGASCAIGAGNVAYCWGANTNGELGIGSASADTALFPGPAVAGNHAFVDIASSGGHACAITTSGSAYCWGRGTVGSLGDGSGAGSAEPRLVAGNLVFKAIAAGDFYTCGLTTAGEAYCWGNNQNGQLGTPTGTCLGTTTPCSATPVAVTGGHIFESLSAGNSAACGVKSTGDIYCWGFSYGTTPAPFRSVLASEPGGVRFRVVSGGGGHICAITTDGDMWCRGRNNIGQLGNGTTLDPSEIQTEPTLVIGGIKFRTP